MAACSSNSETRFQSTSSSVEESSSYQSSPSYSSGYESGYSYGTSSSSPYRDDVDEIYDHAAKEAKAELRQACREAGVDYNEYFDDSDIDRQAEELKAETRRMMQELDY